MKSFVEAMNGKLDALSSHMIKYKIAVSKYSLAQLSTPISLFLSNCDISHAFDGESDVNEAKQKCGELVELDLGSNHLNQWPEILKIVDTLPKLSILNLSNNKLGAIGPIDKLPTYPKLSTIILNRTNISWTDVGHLIEVLPELKELHLVANNFASVGIDTVGDKNEITVVPAHENLERLLLDRNSIRDWNEVVRLGRVFPKLRSLSLSGCPIASLECSTVEMSDAFPELDHLNLSDTRLQSWDDIFHLTKLDKLRKLCIRRLPLFNAYAESCQHTVWKLLVGILPALQILNNSLILKEDRWDASALIEIEFQGIRT